MIFRPSFVFGTGRRRPPTFVRDGAATCPSPRSQAPASSGSSRSGSTTWPSSSRARSTYPGQQTGTFELGGPETLELERALGPAGQPRSGKRRAKVHLPLALLRAAAVVLELLPQAPVTRDQLTMLELEDNVGDPPANGAFGVEPIPLAEQLRRSLG